MALVKKAAETSETSAAFEEVESGAEQAVETVAEQAVEKAAAAPAPAVRTQNTAVAAPLAKMVAVLADYQNALPAVDFGVLPRLKGSNGLIFDGDNAKLGATIQLTLISWNDQFVITPGDDDDASREFVKYSLDGKTIDSTGVAVSAYIERLKTVDGFKDAEMKQYCELVGILNHSDSASEHVGNMVQISLSPQSRKAFEAYRLQRSVKVKMNRETLEGSEELTIRAVVKTMGKFTFTVLQVSDK